MLVLSRQLYEVVNIFLPDGTPVGSVSIVEVRGGNVKLGLDFPQEYKIYRSEHGNPYLTERPKSS